MDVSIVNHNMHKGGILGWLGRELRPSIVVCAGAMTALSMTTLACTSDTSDFMTARAPHEFYATMTFAHHAINMATVAPYDTIHVLAVGSMQDGSPVPGAVVYTSSDSTVVSVDSAGLLTAHGVTSGTMIRASLTYDGITRMDSALVAVTSTLPSSSLQRLSIVPPHDSAVVPSASLFSNTSKSLLVVPTGAPGDTLSSLVFDVGVSDSTKATVARSSNTLVVTGHSPGRVMLYASTLAYGVVKRDSLAFMIGWPDIYLNYVNTRYKTGTKTPIKYFTGDTITIGVGANVLWINTSDTVRVDVIFDNPAAAEAATGTLTLYAGTSAGNIPPFGSHDTLGFAPGYAARSFTRPGKYPYHSARFGTGGTIVVCANSDTTCLPR